MGKWDVYRDPEGDPVTITEEQGRAIHHALTTVEAVRKAEGAPSLWKHQDPQIEIAKSRLLGRMLYAGRAPLDEKPPHRMGACAYHLTDPDLCPYCGMPRSGRGGELGRSVDPRHDISIQFSQITGDPLPDKVMIITYCNSEWHSNRRGLWS